MYLSKYEVSQRSRLHFFILAVLLFGVEHNLLANSTAGPHNANTRSYDLAGYVNVTPLQKEDEKKSSAQENKKVEEPPRWWKNISEKGKRGHQLEFELLKHAFKVGGQQQDKAYVELLKTIPVKSREELKKNCEKAEQIKETQKKTVRDGQSKKGADRDPFIEKLTALDKEMDSITQRQLLIFLQALEKSKYKREETTPSRTRYTGTELNSRVFYTSFGYSVGVTDDQKRRFHLGVSACAMIFSQTHTEAIMGDNLLNPGKRYLPMTTSFQIQGAYQNFPLTKEETALVTGKTGVAAVRHSWLFKESQYEATPHLGIFRQDGPIDWRFEDDPQNIIRWLFNFQELYPYPSDTRDLRREILSHPLPQARD